MSLDQAQQRAERLVKELWNRAQNFGGMPRKVEDWMAESTSLIAAELLAVQRLERERCAKIADVEQGMIEWHQQHGGEPTYVSITKAIRGEGQ